MVRHVASLHGAPANHVLRRNYREKLYRLNFSSPQRWIMNLLDMATPIAGVHFQRQAKVPIRHTQDIQCN